jgi:hypothetical protein
MQVIRKLFIARFFVLMAMSFAAAFAPHASAQVQRAAGKATVPYTGKAVTPDVKAKALQNAQLKAVEFYYAEAGESEAANFDAMRQKIIDNPDRYILDSTVLAEEDNASSKSYTVSVRVSLNVANLRNDIKAGSAVGKATRTERSALAFVFVSREQDSEKSYDTRVTKRADLSEKGDATVQQSGKGTEGEKISRGRISTDESRTDSVKVERNVSVTTETGGTRTRRASESTWRLSRSADLNQVFMQTFTRAGYKVNEASLVEPYTGGKFKVSMVENDYKAGNDLQSSTMQGITQGMKNAQIPYIALGTLDLGLADTDPQTGMQRVAVTVNARVLDVRETIPDTIVSVGPVQYAGVGPTEAEARTNALKLAANNAARELTAQLTNLGIK